MGAATLFVHNVSIFCGFRKIILGVIKKWNSEAALTLPVMEIKPRLFYRVVKKLGRPRPFSDFCRQVLSGQYLLTPSLDQYQT